MATTKQITGKYIEFIATEVIKSFGGSYQTYETMGKVWRQKLPYTQQIEDFLILKTNVFLAFLDVRDQGNFNLMYKVSYNIAEHLSKYLVKKSPDLTREIVTNTVIEKIFLNSSRFIRRFEKAYKRPINLDDTHYVISNPGVIAMYNFIQTHKR